MTLSVFGMVARKFNSIQYPIPPGYDKFLFVNIEEELYFTNEGIHLTMKNNIKGEYG